MMYRYVLAFTITLVGCVESDVAETVPDNSPACTSWSEGKQFGTPYSDEALDVIIDPDANLYLAGYENGITGSTNLEPSASAYGIIFKYDRAGTLIANMVLDTTGASTVEALAFKPQSGELYLAGRTNGAITGFSNSGKFDLLVGWLGPEQWQPHLFQMGNERPQHPRRLSFGSGETLVVAGYDDIYVPTNYVETWENPILTTLTKSGDSLTTAWSYDYISPHSDAFNGLAVAATTDGSVYVTGRSDGVTDRGISVYKYNPQGVLLWQSRLTNITYDNGAAVEVLADGNLLVVGSTFAQLGTQHYGQMDIVLAKLDTQTGGLLWVTQYGSSETEWVTDMAIDKAGQIYVVGETLGVIESGQTNVDQNAIFLVKFDVTGKVKMARQWNSGGLDVPTAVAVDACGHAFIAGYTASDLVGPSKGARDGFVFPVATQ